MSNKAKSVFFKLLSFACCVVPPVVVMIQNGCFAPKNANAFQRLGIVGVALAIVIAISGSRYLREFIKPIVTAPVMVFLVLWILCGALSGVIAQFAQAMKIGCISSAVAVGFDIASYVFKKRGEAEEKEQK